MAPPLGTAERSYEGSLVYLDVDFEAEGLRLAVSVADVEAKDVPGGLGFAAAVLDVEDAARGHVLHRERRVESDLPGTANRVCGQTKRRTLSLAEPFNALLKVSTLEFGRSLKRSFC